MSTLQETIAGLLKISNQLREIKSEDPATIFNINAAGAYIKKAIEWSRRSLDPGYGSLGVCCRCARSLSPHWYFCPECGQQRTELIVK